MTDFAAKSLTTKYGDFESDRLTFTDLEENERSKGQLIAYPRYNHPSLGENQPLFIQGPWMTIFTYGIPSLGEYYSDDSQRAFVKVALNLDDPEVKKMAEELKKVDAVLGADEYKDKSFQKKASKYTYQPIIREPTEDDDGVVKPAYMKLKLDLTWPEGNVKTEVLKSELVNGKRVREPVSISTVTDLTSHLSYQTKYRPIFRPVKMWAHHSKMKDPQYGVVFKLVKVEVEPNKSGNSLVSDYLGGDAFIDDDEDEVEEKPVAKEVAVPKSKVETKADKKKVVEEVVEEEEEEDEDEESVTEDSSDEDSDSDSEEPPKKPVAKQKKTKSKTSKA